MPSSPAPGHELAACTNPAAHIEQAVTNSGFWGLHLMETNLNQGILIDLVRRLSTSDP